MKTQIYDARLCTSNQEKNSHTKNKLPKQLVRSVGCRYGVQRVMLNLPNVQDAPSFNLIDAEELEI